MKKNDGVQTPYKGGIRNRRSRSLERLKAQLKSGFKHNIVNSEDSLTPLTEQDVKRINKEIEVLTSKI